MVSFSCACCSGVRSSMVTSMTSPISGILIQLSVSPGVPKSVLTQNSYLAPSTQQAEQASLAHEQIPKRASQFS
jgi:hypothetical protein